MAVVADCRLAGISHQCRKPASQPSAILHRQWVSGSLLRLEFRGNVVGPHARAMDYAKDAHGIPDDLVRCDIGRARDHQFARAFDPAQTPAIREIFEALGCCLNPIVHIGGGLRIILGNLNEYRQTVSRRAIGPSEFHCTGLMPFRAFARSSANRAETSASPMSGRSSSSASCTRARNHWS